MSVFIKYITIWNGVENCMKGKISLYVCMMIMSIILFILSLTFLGNTIFIAPILIVISIYLFLGSLIKLCKMNDKFKNSILCIIDLLFWLP